MVHRSGTRKHIQGGSDGALLPLIVVSIGFGLPLLRLSLSAGSRGQFFQGIWDAFLVLVGYVIKLAPIGVFALAVPLAARMGIAAVGALAYYIVIFGVVCTTFYLADLISCGAFVWTRIALAFHKGSVAGAGGCIHLSLFAGFAARRL